jgi:hypothetical protein
MKPLFALFLASVMSVSSGFSRDFVHPGARESREELDYVKIQIQAGVQPWKAEFDRIKGSSLASRGPHGLSNINSRTSDAEISRDDAAAAYTQALLWYFTDDVTYAERSIAILNSWAGLQAFVEGSDQDRLQAGWIGSVFAPAAEIMRWYEGWSASDISALQEMFKRAFYPKLNTASSWNGNVDLTQIDAMMAIAVFNEDEAEFDLGLERLRNRVPAYFYLKSDGSRPVPIAGDGGNIENFWGNPLIWVDGLTQETCRDNGHHAQYGLGSALHAAEVAWHQGVDVYAEFEMRFTAAMELMSTQFTSGSMQGVASDDVPSTSRFNTWEIGYNHYHNRAGVELPKTKQLIEEQIRPAGSRADWNLIYETLTHAELPGNLSTCAVDFGHGGIFVDTPVDNRGSFLSNLSVRAPVDEGATLKLGFVVTGGAKTILARAAGPALAGFGLSNTMEDPRLEIRQGTAVLAGNDNWSSTIEAEATTLGAFPFANGSSDSGLTLDLENPNTCEITGEAGGIVLGEVYDVSPSATGPRLSNVSALHFTGEGEDVLTAGFVVGGTGKSRLLIRGVGPELNRQFGINGVLSDPVITLIDGNRDVVARNDDWDSSLTAVMAELGAFALTAGSKDAAMVVTVDAGRSFTVQVSGCDGGSGIAIIEVYEMR